jgi:NIPSNAP
METNQGLKVIELRNYLLKPGARERFIDYFEDHFIDSQNILGGHVLGVFRVKGADDNFFWIRGFEDMKSRVTFLRAFYELGPVWKEFGSGANEMMLDSDNVYLLRPLSEGKTSSDESESTDSDLFAILKGVVVIDLYTANDNQLDELIDFFRAEYLPFLKGLLIQDTTLWISETSENDFPRLPVKQGKNTLVAISSFEDESEYQAKLKQINSADARLKSRMQELIAARGSLVLYSTKQSNQ